MWSLKCISSIILRIKKTTLIDCKAYICFTLIIYQLSNRRLGKNLNVVHVLSISLYHKCICSSIWKIHSYSNSLIAFAIRIISKIFSLSVNFYFLAIHFMNTVFRFILLSNCIYSVSTGISLWISFILIYLQASTSNTYVSN